MRYMVLREMTTGFRRTDSLEAMGLGRVTYEGLSEHSKGVRDWAAMVGISPAEAVEAISLMLDLWRRSQFLYVATDPIYSRFHAKDDPFIQAGLLNLREFRPGGLLLENKNENKYARGLIAKNGASAVQGLVKKWAADNESLDVDAAISALWEILTGPMHLLSKVTLRNQRGDKALDGDVWQVNAENVCVAKANGRERCNVCQRVATRKAPNAACTRHHCQGHTATELPDQENYDVWLMGQPFVMVTGTVYSGYLLDHRKRTLAICPLNANNGPSNFRYATHLVKGARVYNLLYADGSVLTAKFDERIYRADVNSWGRLLDAIGMAESAADGRDIGGISNYGSFFNKAYNTVPVNP